MNRRNALLLMSAASLSAALPARLKKSGRSAKPLGLQSFTILRLLEADFAGTLALVSSLGYTELETMGSFGRDPAWVHEQLTAHGLTTPSQHLMPGDLYRYFSVPPVDAAGRAALTAEFLQAFAFDRVDTFIAEAIKRAKPMQQRYITWQMNWRPGYTMREAELHAKAFNRAGELCAAEGIQFAFHNHDHEFEPIDGVLPFDYIVAHTDPKLVKIEIDFMWATKSGANPIDLFRRAPGRYRMCHLKDRTAAGEITGTGKGVENFPLLIDAARAAGIEHFFFEYDRPQDPAAEIREAAAFLKPLLQH